MHGLDKPFRNPIQKIEKVKIKVKLPHVNKKPLARKRIFVQTPFYHSTLKSERKIFAPQNHSLFRSTSCFGVTKITTPIWLQKSWKCENRSLKKRQRPNTFQILWIVKTKRRPIIAPAIAVRLLNIDRNYIYKSLPMPINCLPWEKTHIARKRYAEKQNKLHVQNLILKLTSFSSFTSSSSLEQWIAQNI